MGTHWTLAPMKGPGACTPGSGRRTPNSLSMGGHYEDIYARTSEGWLFKRREFFRGKVTAVPTPAAPSLVDMRLPRAGATSSTKRSTLTPMDYIEIRKLVSNYAYGL